MKIPTLQRIELREAEQIAARELLEHAWQLPDGTEVVDHYALRRYRRQLREGYYYRLVWPEGTTAEDAIAWDNHIRDVLRWRREGLI